MEQEEWKPVVGYENNYEVSNLGRVKSLPREGTKGGILKPYPDGDGYLKVKLSKNGEESMHRVHILVVRAFVGECPENHQVDHINFKQDDNRLENLRYLPAKENASRKSPEWQKKNAEAVKRRSQNQEWRKNHSEAMKRTKSKPVNQYTLDGEFVRTWESATYAAREIGGNQSNISACCRGKRKSIGGFIWKFAV